MSIKAIFFVLLSGFLGFCTAMIIYSFGDTRSDGFSSAASAFGNGLLGGVLGMILGGILAKKLRPSMFRLVFVVLIIVLGVLGLWLFKNYE